MQFSVRTSLWCLTPVLYTVRCYTRSSTPICLLKKKKNKCVPILFTPNMMLTTNGFRLSPFFNQLALYSTSSKEDIDIYLFLNKRTRLRPAISSDTALRTHASSEYRFKEQVFDLLDNTKQRMGRLNSEELREIQEHIEELSMHYEDCNIFKTLPQQLVRHVLKNELSVKASILTKKKVSMLT